MGWCVDVCRVILSMWFIIGGRWVCCIVGLCMMYLGEQRTCVFF